MPEPDLHGLPLTTASANAAAAYRQGIELYFAAWAGTGRAIDEAIGHDPDFALPRAAKAVLLSNMLDHTGARTQVSQAVGLVAKNGTPREQSHVNVIRLMIEGPTPEVIPAALAHVDEWPRDALILSFLLGAFGLLAFSGMADHDQARVDLCERYVPQYGDDWWFLTYKGWADAENGSKALGRRQVVRALELRRENGNASHSYAHALFEDGSSDEAEAFLNDWLPIYHPKSPLYTHVVWHTAWLALDRGDIDRAFDIYHSVLRPALEVGMPAVVVSDAASFLWRVRAYGYDVPAGLWGEVAKVGESSFPKGGFPFVDMHMAFVGGATGDLDDYVRRAADHERLIASHELPGGRTAPEVCRGMISFAKGDYQASARTLETVAHDVVRMGGSGAQRSIVEDTLLMALIRSGEVEKAAALLDRRIETRPSPRNRQWRSDLAAGGSSRIAGVPPAPFPRRQT